MDNIKQSVEDIGIGEGFFRKVRGVVDEASLCELINSTRGRDIATYSNRKERLRELREIEVSRGNPDKSFIGTLDEEIEDGKERVEKMRSELINNETKYKELVVEFSNLLSEVGGV